MADRRGAVLGGHGFMRQVKLKDVRPNPDNPRRDMGDLDALAERIMATGGVPVNPIVVMEDGEVCRIVDGERRYRAMLRIHDEEDWVSVIWCHDFAEASAVVAAIATDEKRPLTPEEQARGFQSMMALGVPEEDASRASGIGVEQVRRAKRSLGAMAKVEQTSLDAMVAAGDDEFSEDEREQILRAGSDGSWESPEMAAKRIKGDHRRLDRLSRIRLALPDCVEFRDENHTCREEGLTYVAMARNAKEAAAFEPEDGTDYVAYLHGSAGGETAWAIYRRLAEGETAVSAEDARKAAEKEEYDRRLGMCARMRESMMEWLVDRLEDAVAQGKGPSDALPAMAALATERRGRLYMASYGMDVVPPAIENSASWRPSAWEVLKALDGLVGSTGSYWRTPFSNYSDGKDCVRTAWDACVADGWAPPEDIAEIRKACGEVKE